MLSLKNIWIKAAVEHRILNIDYFSARTKQEQSNREVEPDFVGTSRDGKNNGFWATFCHLRDEGPRVFKSDSIRNISITSKTFIPSSKGRWEELIDIYNELGLESKNFEGESI